MCFFAFNHIYLLFIKEYFSQFSGVSYYLRTFLFLNSPYEFQKFSMVISSQHHFLQGCPSSSKKKGKQKIQYFLENRTRLSAAPSQSVLITKSIQLKQLSPCPFLVQGFDISSGYKKACPCTSTESKSLWIFNTCPYRYYALFLQGFSTQP